MGVSLSLPLRAMRQGIAQRASLGGGSASTCVCSGTGMPRGVNARKAPRCIAPFLSISALSCVISAAVVVSDAPRHAEGRAMHKCLLHVVLNHFLIGRRCCACSSA